ncbi:hypothetical protein [Amycolatopsis sp. NPDC051061]|uniref:hypothetical protein n=1 Tax=Amycolatopsis sp. NPDC051061 TaxID=3155042 RepID=UPI0034197CFB
MNSALRRARERHAPSQSQQADFVAAWERAEITGFLDPAMYAGFGLPPELP